MYAQRAARPNARTMYAQRAARRNARTMNAQRAARPTHAPCTRNAPHVATHATAHT